MKTIETRCSWKFFSEMFWLDVRLTFLYIHVSERSENQ